MGGNYAKRQIYEAYMRHTKMDKNLRTKNWPFSVSQIFILVGMEANIFEATIWKKIKKIKVGSQSK